MIAVLDSGVANLASVTAALHRLQCEVIITSDADVLRKAARVIIPGVGSAAAAMASLEKKKLVEVVRQLCQPVLGICLGMQLLFSRSEEGETACLDIISGEVLRLTSTPDNPVPHMGWNTLKRVQTNHPLLASIDDDSFVYFVHGFAVPCGSYTVASTNYASLFASIVAERNFFGCQFHPERSSAVGQQILKNFLDL